MTQTGEKIRKQTTTVKGRQYVRYVVDYGLNGDGKRVRRTFKSIEDAEADLKKQNKLQARIGRKARRLKDRDLEDAATALEMLKGRASLITAVDFYINHTTPPGGKRTVDALLAEYLKTKRDAGRREPTIVDIKHRIGKLAEDYGNTPVHEITTEDLEKWLNTRNYRNGTRANFKRLFTGFFNYALKRKLVNHNPAVAIEKPSIDETIPEIFTPDEAQKLLHSVQETHPGMTPYFALGLFAGIRPAELRKLDWKNIDLAAKRIKIIPETAKKRRQRYIDISDNLLAWLSAYGKPDGLVYYSRRAFAKAREDSGVRWSHDIMRHSYGSYHLGEYEDGAKTALQMGHQNTLVLFNHYRELVTREDAHAFWSITPKTKENVVQFTKAG